jgi:hypothetical protein
MGVGLRKTDISNRGDVVGEKHHFLCAASGLLFLLITEGRKNIS